MTIICLIEVWFSQQTLQPPEWTLPAPISEQASFSGRLLTALYNPHCISGSSSSLGSVLEPHTGKPQRASPKEIMQNVTQYKFLFENGRFFLLLVMLMKNQKRYFVSLILKGSPELFLSHALLLLHIPHKSIFTIPSGTNFFYFWEQKRLWNAFVWLAVSRCIKLLLHKRICTLH